jgi:hypothetical protein
LDLVVPVLLASQFSAAAAPASWEEHLPRHWSFPAKFQNLSTSQAIDAIFQNRWPDDDRTFFVAADGEVRPAQRALADRDAKAVPLLQASEGNVETSSQIDFQSTEVQTKCGQTRPAAMATGVIAAHPNAGEAGEQKDAGVSPFAQPIPFVAEMVNRQSDSLLFIQKAQAVDVAPASPPASEVGTRVLVTPKTRRWVGGVMHF